MTDDLFQQLKSRFRRLEELRVENDEAQATADATKRSYREYERELYDELEEAGIRKTLTFDFGEPIGEVSFTPRKPTIYGRVLDEGEARRSLEAIGREEELFRPKIASKRLNEFVRQCLEDGVPLPDGLDFYERGGITISRK